MLNIQIKFNYFLVSSNLPSVQHSSEMSDVMISEAYPMDILRQAWNNIQQDIIKGQIGHVLHMIMPQINPGWSCQLSLSEDITCEERTFSDGSKTHGYDIGAVLQVVSANFHLTNHKEKDNLIKVLSKIINRRVQYLRSLFACNNARLTTFNIEYEGSGHDSLPGSYSLDDLSIGPNAYSSMLLAFGITLDSLSNNDTALQTDKNSILCFLTKDIMVVPVRDIKFPNNPCIEFEVYRKFIRATGKNPFTNQAITLEELVIDHELQAQIGNRINEMKSTAPLRRCVIAQEHEYDEIIDAEITLYDDLSKQQGQQQLFTMYYETKKQIEHLEKNERDAITSNEKKEQAALATPEFYSSQLDKIEQEEVSAREKIIKEVDKKIEMFDILDGNFREKKNLPLRQ